MDTLEKINLAISSKADIKAAIVAKGGSIEGDFSTFADAITNLPSGGGDVNVMEVAVTLASNTEVFTVEHNIGNKPFAFSIVSSLLGTTYTDSTSSVPCGTYWGAWMACTDGVLGLTVLKSANSTALSRYIGNELSSEVASGSSCNCYVDSTKLMIASATEARIWLAGEYKVKIYY